MRGKRLKSALKAHKELREHKKYRKEFASHIQRFLSTYEDYHSSEEIAEMRRDAIRQLMDSRWAGPRTLEKALGATRQNTIGQVQVIGDHPKSSPRSRKIAFRYLDSYKGGEDKGSKAKQVWDILEHDKTGRSNAHVFLKALERYGFNRTMHSMNKEGVNARNILSRLKKMKEKEKKETKKIELPEQ